MKTKIYLSLLAVTTCVVTGWQGISPSHAQSFVSGTSRSVGISVTVGGTTGFPVRGYAATTADTTTYSSGPNGGGLSGKVNTSGEANTGVGNANYRAGAGATVAGTSGNTTGITAAATNGNAVVAPNISGAGFVSVGGYTGYSRP